MRFPNSCQNSTFVIIFFLSSVKTHYCSKYIIKNFYDVIQIIYNILVFKIHFNCSHFWIIDKMHVYRREGYTKRSIFSGTFTTQTVNVTCIINSITMNKISNFFVKILTLGIILLCIMNSSAYIFFQHNSPHKVGINIMKSLIYKCIYSLQSTKKRLIFNE